MSDHSLRMPPLNMGSSDMGNPPGDLGAGLNTGGPSVVVVPMSELLEPPHPPAVSGLYPIVVGGKFPDMGWDPGLRAQVALAEFAETAWRRDADPGPPDDDPDALVQEIKFMMSPPVLLHRNRRMAEIIAQAQDASVYWTDMLMLTPAARPWTCLLLRIAQLVGQMVAMHFKHKYMRARPVQVYPAIMPPVLTPAHPSYPNAHALQSQLISRSISMACPAFGEPLMALAERVGENRVIAGLHFPSDTDKSIRIAEQLMPLLGAGAEFKKALAGAATELKGLFTYPTGDSVG